MLRSKLFVKRHNLIAIILLITCLMFLSVSAWSSRSYSRQQSDPQVENKTQALQLVELVRNEGAVKLSLKNVSLKNIKGYTVSIGNIRMEEDFIYSERAIAPGEIYEVEFPLAKQSKSQGQKVSILSVIFDDLSGDGDTALVNSIKDRRAGEKLQLEHINELIQRTLDSMDSSPQATLNKLKAQLNMLPERQGDHSSQAFKDGLHNGKDEALKEIQRLEQSELSANLTKLRQALGKFKERNKEKAARLLN